MFSDVSNGDENDYGSHEDYEVGDQELDEKHADVAEEEDDEKVAQDAVPQLRRSTRAVTLTDSSMQRMVDNNVAEFGYHCAVVEHDFGDPVTQKQAYDSPFKEEWTWGWENTWAKTHQNTVILVFQVVLRVCIYTSEQ